MPWYRINGMTVHMRGTKLPPACVALVGLQLLGQSALRCMAPSAYLCDGKLEDGSTCDWPLCEAHATQIGADVHLCPSCMAERRDRSGQHNLFTSMVQS